MNKNQEVIMINRFRCYEEMDFLKQHIKKFESNIKLYNGIIESIDKYEVDKVETLLNSIFYLSKYHDYKWDFFKLYPEFRKYDSDNFIEEISHSSRMYNDIKRHQIMYVIYIYLILDECLGDILSNVLNKNISNGVMCKINEIKRSGIEIDFESELKLSIFSQIRNDIIHSNGEFSEKSSRRILIYQHKDANYVREYFGLEVGKHIKLDMDKIKEFINISNNTLKEIYERISNI